MADKKKRFISLGSNKSMSQMLFGKDLTMGRKQSKSKKYRSKTNVEKKHKHHDLKKRSKTDIQSTPAASVLPLIKQKQKQPAKNAPKETQPKQYEDRTSLMAESDNDSKSSSKGSQSQSSINLPDRKLSKRERTIKKNHKLSKSMGNGRLGSERLASGRLGSERIGNGRKRGYSNKVQRSLADMSEIITLSQVNLTSSDSERQHRVTEAAKSFISSKFSLSVKENKNNTDPLDFGDFRYDDFDCFTKPKEYYKTFFHEAFNALELTSLYDENEELLLSFLEEVKNNYRNSEEVPFHNFYHGFSVAQVSIVFIIRCKWLRKLCDKQTIFMLIIAALSHDLDHPGTSNYYETEAFSSIVKTHGKDSPLENMHSEKFLSILRDNDFANNIFKYMTVTSQENINDYIVQLIVATDMSRHKENMDFLKVVRRSELKNLDKEQLLPLLCAVLHACDLSGQCFSKDIAKIWEENIHKEMQTQYKGLVAKGLPVPVHLKHFQGGKTPSMKSRCESQANFIDYHLIPYWKEITRIFPEMKDFFHNLKENGKYFRSEASR